MKNYLFKNKFFSYISVYVHCFLVFETFISLYKGIFQNY